MKREDTRLPEFLKPLFWSYKLESLSVAEHKNLIINNILNFGDKRAVEWLFSTYKKEEIKTLVEKPMPGAFFGNKKSHNFWAFFFDVPVTFTKRNVI